jgi:hypothetical protein
VRRSLLEQFPRADVSASIVWIHMLPDDTMAEAEASAGIIGDPRVRHFHDPRQRMGEAIAADLGWEGQTAWDIYIFYDRDGQWAERPPTPLDFMHQLPWETAHFRTGDALALALGEAMQRLLERAKG